MDIRTAAQNVSQVARQVFTSQQPTKSNSTACADNYSGQVNTQTEFPKDMAQRLGRLCTPKVDLQPKLQEGQIPTVFCTLKDGRVITAATTEQVKEIAERIGDGQLSKMVIQGHANGQKQTLGVWDRESKQGFTLCQDGHISLRDGRDQEIGDLGKLFNKKFDKGHSSLIYQGCYTAQDMDKNLAKASSEALPGVRVIGNADCGWGYGHILKTDKDAKTPPLAVGGFSTWAREYYTGTNPRKGHAHAHLVGIHVNEVIR